MARMPAKCKQGAGHELDASGFQQAVVRVLKQDFGTGREAGRYGAVIFFPEILGQVGDGIVVLVETSQGGCKIFAEQACGTFFLDWNCGTSPAREFFDRFLIPAAFDRLRHVHFEKRDGPKARQAIATEHAIDPWFDVIRVGHAYHACVERIAVFRDIDGNDFPVLGFAGADMYGGDLDWYF